MGGSRRDLAWLGPTAVAVARRPGLWATAVRQVLVTAEPGWWGRRPHLPLPPPAYLRFRVATAYGGAGAAPTPDDVVSYLAWCRQERRRRRVPRPPGGSNAGTWTPVGH